MVKRFGFNIVLVFVCLLFLFPFYYMAIQSIMTERELFSLRPQWYPNQFNYENFINLFQLKPFARIMFNSFFVAITVTLLSVVLSALVGFTFAKYQFPGRNWLFIVLLSSMMIPDQITLIPKYLMMVEVFGWQNNFLSVIVPRMVSAFGVFYLRQYAAAAVPRELIDAATIDGAGFFRVFATIAMPMMVPAMTVFGLLAFVWAWNDFLWPLLMLNDLDMQTMPVALHNLKESTGTAENYWSLIMAGTTLATFPLVLLLLFSQRLIVGGLSAGALKGD